MDVIYFSGNDKKIQQELKSILSKKYITKNIKNFSTIENNSILIVDLTKFDKENWKVNLPKGLLLPKALSIDNIRVIPIINRELHDFAMDLLENDFEDFLQYPFDLPRVLGTIINTFRDIEYENELASLYKIGTQLSSELDLEKLLQEILKVSIDFTNSDGGSIYLVIPEFDPQTGEKIMQFEISMSDTLDNRYQKIKMPINNKSLAGYVISTGKNLIIQDAYNLPDNVPYSFDSSLDKKNNYISKTMLIIPMVNHNNENIGAIQLINKKKDRKKKLSCPEFVEENVIEFSHKNQLLIRSLGSQATIVVETAQLYKEIHTLFESFMEASVSAVESRDPSTAGHSRRVSKLSTSIANLINLSDDKVFAKYNFSINDIKTIKYAGLLHDFGKIGVTERILLKAKKLFVEEINNIETRMELLKFSKNRYQGADKLDKIISEVDDLRYAIIAANEPVFISDEIAYKLKKANETDIVFIDQKKQPVLDEGEYNRLTNSRGSLSEEEYEIMKYHVENTYKFLNFIKWPIGLGRVPIISRYHHEKLDGSGYPLGIKGDEIPIESQILCIADIFDALISNDRPYKNKISVKQALDILEQEAQEGRINKDILHLMIKFETYKIILDEIEKRNE